MVCVKSLKPGLSPIPTPFTVGTPVETKLTLAGTAGAMALGCHTIFQTPSLGSDDQQS